MLSITLTPMQLSSLFRQKPNTRTQGGFQSLLVKLQEQVDRVAQRLFISANDFERIRRYALRYKTGGWQTRLKSIFWPSWKMLKGEI